MKTMTTDQAIADINKEIAEIENLANEGLWEAGLQIINLAQHRLQPSVVTGNLRASAYVRNSQQQEQPDTAALDPTKDEGIPVDRLPEIGVELGFTANYAVYVHENMEGRSPKYLEGPIVENQKKIVEIIKRRSGGE